LTNKNTVTTVICYKTASYLQHSTCFSPRGPSGFKHTAWKWLSEPKHVPCCKQHNVVQ